VANFLGASNLLEGKLERGGDELVRVRLTVGSDVLVPADRVPIDVDSIVKVGVRPEKITIQPEEDAQPAGHNAVSSCLLLMATYIGVSHQYKVEAPDGTDLRVYVQNLGAARAPQPGERVRLVWRPEHTFAVKPSKTPTEEEE